MCQVHCSIVDDVQEHVFYLLWLGLEQMRYFVVYFIVLCHGRHSTHHGVSIMRKVITISMDVCSCSLGKPHEKQHKYIPLVGIFLRIRKPRQILYFHIFLC